MGTTVECVVWGRNDPKAEWEHVKSVKSISEGQDYYLFSFVADVRNDWDHEPWQDKPRGLPGTELWECDKRKFLEWQDSLLFHFGFDTSWPHGVTWYGVDELIEHMQKDNKEYFEDYVLELASIKDKYKDKFKDLAVVFVFNN